MPAGPEAAGRKPVCLLLPLPHVAQRQLNRYDQQQDRVEIEFHGITSFVVGLPGPGASRYLKIFTIWTMAGPRITTKRAGMMNRMSGKTIFTVVLAAASSAIWRRLVLRESE